MSKRTKYKIKEDGKFFAPALTSMRETAFGWKSYFETKSIIDRAERMRDDDALLEAAEAKRLRKMERRAEGMK